MTTTENSKEVLHTQGEWIMSNDNTRKRYSILNEDHTKRVAYLAYEYPVTSNEAKANAELIVRAVNERQKLLDSNRELLEAVKAWMKYLDDGYIKASYQNRDAILKAETAINNAKNI